MAEPGAVTDQDADVSFSLPAWIYRDVEFFHLEMARVMRPSWQVVCHVSDLPQAGSYHTLKFLGDNILVIRGEDGVIRGMANVCRHRGAILLDQPCGKASRLSCPYHAWSYDFEGQLTGVPMRETYDDHALRDVALPQFEIEVWRGFVFVRLEGQGPSVSDIMAPFAAELHPYRFEDMRAIGRVTLRPRTVNWKNISDNYSDGLHIRVAHPGLTRLLGKGYGVEAHDGVDRMWGHLLDRPSEALSERMYQAVLPDVAHLPDSHKRLWFYFKLWPNVAFDIYPDQVDFMQFLPISPTETLIREIAYALPDERREMKVARYLNWRINRQVNAEDTKLVQRVQDGMASPSFTVGPLSETEVCLRSFGKRLRSLIPEARLHRPPPDGWSRNAVPQP